MSQSCGTTLRHAENLSQAGILSRFIENWQARRAVAGLLKVDEHLLRDMGTSRADVAWAARLPLSLNAAEALEERTRFSQKI